MKKKITILTVLVVLIFHNYIIGQECGIPQSLKKEIENVINNNNFSEKDFHTINQILFKYDYDSLSLLMKCSLYNENIVQLFNSDKSAKRVVAYRLIGVARDTRFNDELIKRIRSDESDFLKTWSSTALMENRCSAASDDLFKLFSSYPTSIPIDILINIYVKYDPVAVKKTCWKFIDSKERNEQILSIQCLANFESNKKLQKRLFEFLETWDIKSKGWVISSMSMQKMGHLKPVLEKYSTNEDLKRIIIAVLKNSPTKEDNEFAMKLDEGGN